MGVPLRWIGWCLRSDVLVLLCQFLQVVAIKENQSGRYTVRRAS